MKAWRWNGSEFTECAAVPLTDRGFRYGMSVFESLRVTRGIAEFLEQHAARLQQAAAARDFICEDAAIAQLARVFAHQPSDGFARIYLTAGDGGPAAPVETSRVYVFLEDRTPPKEEDTWEIGLHDESYTALFGGLKTANYWFNCDALARAQKRGFEEALLFNDRAELVSACMANVFVVHDDRISTPPRSSGTRAGVIREWVIGRRKVEERRLRREDVINADEIFLTNSWIGVMPVATLEGRALGHRTIAPRLAAELAQRRAAL